MCIIYSCKTSRPTDDEILRADDRNSDGIGVAWRETDKKGKRKVVWEKGLKVEELLDMLHNAAPPFPYVLHFRSASMGQPDVPELTHPFVASPAASVALRGEAEQVLFHNGSWHMWKSKLRDDLIRYGKKVPAGPWSDSRAIAWYFGVYGPEIFRFEDFSGDQRLLLFSATRTERWGAWGSTEGYDFSRPTNSSSTGINITDKDVWEKRQRKERGEPEEEEKKIEVWRHQPSKADVDLLSSAKRALLPPGRTREEAKEKMSAAMDTGDWWMEAKHRAGKDWGEDCGEDSCNADMEEP